MFLTRDAIIGVKDFGVKEIFIEEWNGTVFLRKWTGKDRSLFWSKSIVPDGDGAKVNWDNLFDNMVLVVAMSLCDENGNRLFTTSKEDLKLLSEKNGDIIQRLYTAALELNGLAKDSTEEAAKNSNPVLSGDSTSGLQENSDTQSENCLKE